MTRLSILASCSLLLASADLQLDLDPGTGAFKVSYHGELWLKGDEYRVGKLAASSKGLVTVGTGHSEGKDALGEYHATWISWAAATSRDRVLMKTSFLQYPSIPSVITFEQHFPSTLNITDLSVEETLSTNTSQKGKDLLAATVFPGFARGASAGVSDLPCFAYHGVFPSLHPCKLSDYKATPQGGAPLVMYKPGNEKLPMLVFSSLDKPMAHQMAHSEDFWGAGVKPTVQEIPAGWRQSFILSAGEGVNAGLMDWGSKLLKFAGKQRVDNRYLDTVHSTIGFWTDNGGYYHYAIGKNKSLGSNYEEVLPKVKAYHDELGVPFGHWQFDSWFYPKDGGVDPGGGGGAVINWTSMPSIFPHGMAYIQSKLKVPIVMHNRQWSVHSDYIRNWTDIEWYISKDAAVPKDPSKFFKRFFTQQEGWGLAMYEQDWMNTEYDEAKALQTNISMGDLWLQGMAAGAGSSNRTIQYCMPYPNEVLAAAALPQVTNARATGDYFHARDQWAVGATASFYWALNILPFKDGFYSSSLKQTGGQTVGPETHPDREALMATLSAAMVGPMDGIYLLNKSRVMTTCRSDGVVLKPDKPITTTDACFQRLDPTCKVYETFSDVAGLGRVHYYFNNDGKSPLLAEEVYEEPSDQRVVYNWYTGQMTPLAASNHIQPGYEGHIYAIVTPVKDGWAFVGEVSTYVTASSTRFLSLATGGGHLSVRIRAAPKESVRVCAARVPTLKLLCKTFSPSDDDNENELVFLAAEWEAPAGVNDGPVEIVV